MQQLQGDRPAPASAVRCPSCGSTDVAAIPLSLIQSKYYQCVVCIVTFRVAPENGEYADIDRFNRDFPGSGA